MLSSVTGAQVAGITRHILTIVGAYFIAKLNIDANTLAAVVASLATVAGLFWSIASKQPIDVSAVSGSVVAVEPVKPAVEPVSLMGKFKALPLDEPAVKVKRKYVRKDKSVLNSRKK